MVGVEAPVGQQIQIRVEQLSVQFVQRQAAPAALTQDTQHRFGALHYAYLPIPVVSDHLASFARADGFPVLPGRA